MYEFKECLEMIKVYGKENQVMRIFSRILKIKPEFEYIEDMKTLMIAVQSKNYECSCS